MTGIRFDRKVIINKREVVKKTLYEVLNDGQQLRFVDGTILQIDLFNSPTVITWSPMDEIEIREVEGGGYILRNMGNGVQVKGTKLLSY